LKALHFSEAVDSELQVESRSKYIASTFTLVLNWWGESRHPLPPDEIDDVFRALVLPTLAATGE